MLKGLEKLGMKLISGKKHWKLEYGNVRMPMSKTPSDYRAGLNSSADMANRCFRLNSEFVLVVEDETTVFERELSV